MKNKTLTVTFLLLATLLCGWSPFTPPIADRLKTADAVVEGFFQAPKDQDSLLHEFVITKMWPAKTRIPRHIFFLDDSKNEEIFGGEVFVGEKPFEYETELVLILKEKKDSQETQYYKLHSSLKIDDDEIDEAKSLWRQKRFKK